MSNKTMDKVAEMAAKRERERLLKRIEQQICFDALADADGRCNNHSGKCYELRQLIDQEKGNA